MTSLNKLLGYVLLTAGLLLIGWTVWQSYNIFYGKISAPFVFMAPAPVAQKAGDRSQSAQGLLGLLGVQTLSQEQIQKTIQQQIGQILPAGDITKILNLLSWSLLAAILIMGGGAVSGIGVKLIK